MNTNKTYVAFDAQGVYDHEHSNLHYYQQMREWQRQYPQRYAGYRLLVYARGFD